MMKKKTILTKKLFFDQKEDDFDRNVQRLKKYHKGLLVSDLFHLLKSMKRKLLGNIIILVCEKVLGFFITPPILKIILKKYIKN